MDNLELGGHWDETYVKYLWSTLKICVEGQTNNKGVPCGTSEELKKIMEKRFYLSVYYQIYFVDSQNYDKPMDIVYAINYFIIDPKIMKSNSFHFKKGEIITDYGWLLNEEETSSAMSLESVSYDQISKTELSDDEQSSLAELDFYITKQEEYFKRNYSKIQNLAADVGGVLKIFFMVNNIIGTFLARKKIMLDLMMLENRNVETNKCESVDSSNNNLNLINQPKILPNPKNITQHQVIRYNTQVKYKNQNPQISLNLPKISFCKYIFMKLFFIKGEKKEIFSIREKACSKIRCHQLLKFV